jgi:transcriptional regulator with GAF, ATPase, and Fis domain
MSARTEVGTAHGAARALELHRLAIVVLGGAQRGAERVMNRPVFRIGKSSENDLALDDETVSRVHCEVVQDRRGFLVRDLDSTNGTLLDGSSIREAYLHPGAVLTVGRIELKVRPYAETIELLPSENDTFGESVGKSLAMRQIFGLLEQLAPSDATVLLEGETGTGKDVLAREVHLKSPRSKRPFVVVDCGAVVGTLIESELFGHERGAFTGAIDSRQGAFELANGGTLFLDEVGELPLDLQPKLLRAIEQRAFRRVGGNREVRVDIRLVAATKRNLKMEVERGKFREDLYFRLAVVPVTLPPLRERREDVRALVLALLERLRGDGPPFEVEPSLLVALEAHEWPGNVRELRNVLERAAYLARARGEVRLGLGHAPLAVAGAREADEEPVFAFEAGLSYRDTKARFEETFERHYVAWLLARHEGNVSAAAREAEMDRKYLHKLVKKHGLA